MNAICPLFPKEIWFHHIIYHLDVCTAVALGRSTKFLNENILDKSKNIWGRSLTQEDQSLLTEKQLLLFIPMLRVIGRLTKCAYYINLFKEDKTFNQFFTDAHKRNCLRRLDPFNLRIGTISLNCKYLTRNNTIDKQSDDREIKAALSIEKELHRIKMMDSWFCHKICEAWLGFGFALSVCVFYPYLIHSNFLFFLNELANFNSSFFFLLTLTAISLGGCLYIGNTQEKELYELSENDDFFKEMHIDMTTLNKNIFRNTIDRTKFHLKIFAPIFCLFYAYWFNQLVLFFYRDLKPFLDMLYR